MDDYLKQFREMISLRGLTDHTVTSYSTYIRAYLDYLSNILHKLPEDVSWAELRGFICLTGWEAPSMNNLKIQHIWMNSYDDFTASGCFQSDVHKKASQAILDCKSGRLGIHISQCPDCGHTEFHNNSCRNRNCPNCQAVQKEIWVDKRRAEVTPILECNSFKRAVWKESRNSL